MRTMGPEFSIAFAALLSVFGESITITRGANNMTVSAIRDRAFTEYNDNDPAQKTRNTVPFRCLVGDYVFGSADSAPKKYDRVTDAAGRQFNVMGWETDATDQVYILNCVEDAG